jgi:methionyl-tRNA synthetase
MKISTEVYDLFSKAIFLVLKSAPPMTFTELSEDVQEIFHQGKEWFAECIPWYTITEKKDMEVKSIIETF